MLLFIGDFPIGTVVRIWHGRAVRSCRVTSVSVIPSQPSGLVDKLLGSADRHGSATVPPFRNLGQKP
ncbi:hypothetical protein HanHA300_Chr16g0632101 [Helianthus annuus]|nr:hypothetical protein HanHA300_Chr16g0632101 [Helianthus annuus]KAJ0462425.1 hypothetical protein HanHA89_Chr16g0683251 [Helianthus annuus]KAJ0642831.1 hypothetical protein HanLR1_Chr16g0642701 [Helianthus annuus]